MPAPTNTSALTATDLGTLPASVSQNVHDAGTTYTVWYQLTASADGVIGIWGFGDLAVYRPDIDVFIGPAAAPVSYLLITATNVPVQLPVASGTTYYFRFTPNAGNPTPAVLLLEAEDAPAVVAPAGSLFVNDDTQYFPAAILSATVDFEVLRFVLDIPAGEAGDIVSNGNFLIEDLVNQVNLCFSSAFVLLATIPDFGSDYAIRTCRGVDKFYLADSSGSPVTLKRISAVGVEETSVGVTGVTEVVGIAVNNDETILYHVAGSTTSAVHRWDMVGATALSDLVAAIATYVSYDLLILSDHTILVSYIKSTTSRSFRVKRYNAAATLLNTYDFDAYINPTFSVMFPRLAYALDDPASFWVFIQDSIDGSRHSKFLNVQVSDGAILVERDHVTFNQGAYAYAETATPLSRFGHSSSCPFFVLPLAAGSGAGGGVIGPLVWVHWPRLIPDAVPGGSP